MKKQLSTCLDLCLSLSVFAQIGGGNIQIGGTQDDLIHFVKTDSQNDIIVVGSFENTVDFDPSSETAELTSFNSTEDIFIVKYNQSLEFQWAHRILAEDEFTVNQVVVDPFDNIYLLGVAEGTLTCVAGFGNQVIGADPSAFLAKYNSSGAYQWVNGIGDGSLSASSSAYFKNMVIENDGSLLLNGRIQGEVDVDPDFSESQLFDGGNGYSFVTNYDAGSGDLLSFGVSSIGVPRRMLSRTDGNYHTAEIGFLGDVQLYTKSIDGTVINGGSLGGGSGSGNFIAGLDTDANGNVYFYFQHNGDFDFDLGSGEHLMQSSGTDIYLAKYTANLELIWVNQYSGTSLTSAMDMVIGNDGVYIAGHFLESMDADPGVAVNTITSTSAQDAFVIKMDEDGIFDWVHLITGQYGVIPRGISVADNGQVAVGGTFGGTIIPYAGETLIDNGSGDGFLITLNQPSTVNIDELDELEVSYYPNPTSNSLQINSLSKIDGVKVFDFAGKHLESIVGNQNDLILDMSNLVPGNYLIEIQSLNKVKTVQVIKR